MMRYTVTASRLAGEIHAPPSKSHSLRAILFASLAEGTSIIQDCFNSPDALAMIHACRLMGAEISYCGDDMTRMTIRGVNGKPMLPTDIIDCGNSGQVLRFIGAIAGLVNGYTVLTGDHSIRFNRPLLPLLSGLEQLGAVCISTKNDGHAPVIIRGPISPGEIQMDGQDSQPVSGLLIACAFLNGKTRLRVDNPGEKPWVQLTLSWFDKLGIRYHNDNFNQYTLNGNAHITGFEYRVTGDFSAIAYPLVAALITGSKLRIANIDMHDQQGDKKIIDILMSMGAKIEIFDNEIMVYPTQYLDGIVIDMNDCIDAITILAVVGCYARGKTILCNAAIARNKECDRIKAISTELKKMGALISETPDGLIIHHSELIGSEVDSYDDHRMCMSLAIAGLGAKGKTIIHGVECVAKSYRDFHVDMRAIGCSMELDS